MEHVLLSGLTVPKLKEKCRGLGLPVGGKKADLIVRIESKLAGAQAFSVEPTPTKAPKAVRKRKTPAENASHPSDEQGTKGKKIRSSSALEVAGLVPSVHQTSRPQLAECERSSDFTNTTVVGHDQATSATTAINSLAATGGGERPAEANVGELLSRGTATATLESRQQLPQIFGSVAGYPKVRDIPTIRPLSRTFQDPDSTTGFPNADLLHLPQPDLRATQRKPNVPSGANFLSVPLWDARKNQSESTSKSTKSLLPSIRKQLEQESPNTSLGADLAVIERKDDSGASKITTRRFKGLKLNINRVSSILETTSTTSGVGKTANHENSPAITGVSTNTSFVSPVTFNILRKQDHEISPLIIRNPPRYSLRRQVERIARILALTAFHSFSNHSVPGDFLKQFTGLSRNYRYASTLAFTHLIRIEFPGQRTERWFKAKGIDEKVADVRSWYWHRVSERKRVIERVRTSWMERVWRFLVLASRPAEPNLVGVALGRFGLWFNGVGQHLLADPDLDGQFETALRFWIRRFYVWVTKSGGGYPQLLDDLREEMVQGIQPLDEKDNQELWRLETRRGGVHFIIGMTGEVVGWVETNGGGGNGLELVRQRRMKTRINTMIRARTTARVIGGEFSAGFSQGGRRRQDNVDDVTWKDLRGDWREHASALVSSVGPPGETDSPPKRLLETVYRPDSKTVSHGIHESVKLPHHHVLAERWILAQVEPGGISGKPVLDALHSQARKKEKVTLDLQAKSTVESVRCSGERWISSMKGVLAQGLGFVQTPGMGWFVLEETGQNIAQEDYGIQGLWATVLGVCENGVALKVEELEALAEMFTWKDTLD